MQHASGAEASSRVSGTILKGLKGLASHLPLSRQARLVRQAVPRRLWFRTALAIARTQGHLVARMGGNGAFTSAMMLDFWLRELSFGGYFPIPYRVQGLDALLAPGPKVYTWTHAPLTELPLRVGLQEGCVPPTVVADPGNVVGDNELLVVGWKERAKAIPADDALLRRVRSTLRGGTPVVFLSDAYLGGPLSDVPLRLAAKLRVPVVFQWAELAADGVIDVTFQYAPHPPEGGEAALEANLAFLRERNREILRRFGWDMT